MCGIVGCLGIDDPQKFLLKGLEALEYRGYDSSGLALFSKNDIHVVRSTGKLSQLKNKLGKQVLDGDFGMAHTRWATHGEVTEDNAHPHCVGDIVVVHNGIVENYFELRESLKKSGAVFRSETDSEVLSHLIFEEYKKTNNFLEACRNVFSHLKGSFAVLVGARGQEEMVAFKMGPPLLIGIGEKKSTDGVLSMLVASDSLAFEGRARKVLYLENGDMAHLFKNEVAVSNLSGEVQKREYKILDPTRKKVDREGFPHFMLKEIFEQPKVMSSTLNPLIDFKNKKLILPPPEVCSQLKGASKIFIIACGTSFYAAMAAKYYIEKQSGLSVEVDIGSEFRYRHTPYDKTAVGVFVSQSGETADTLCSLRKMKESGNFIISICNVEGSSLDRESDFSFYMNSGLEVGVASTKAFTSSLALLGVFAFQLAKIKENLKESCETELVRLAKSLPRHMSETLKLNTFLEGESRKLLKYRGFLYMGRGFNFPIALEGALKLKELAYLHAEGYAFGEMKHGPLALVDEDMLVIALLPKDEFYAKSFHNLEEVYARKGSVLAFGDVLDKKLQSEAKWFFAVPFLSSKTEPDLSWVFNGILQVIPLQLLSYYLADYIGCDVDQPRNLAKSVTVE